MARQQGSLPTRCLSFLSLLKAAHHLWGSHSASLTQQPLPASLHWVPCQEQMERRRPAGSQEAHSPARSRMDELGCTWEELWDLIPEWVGVHRQTVNLRGNGVWEASYTWRYKQKGCVCCRQEAVLVKSPSGRYMGRFGPCGEE